MSNGGINSKCLRNISKIVVTIPYDFNMFQNYISYQHRVVTCNPLVKTHGNCDSLPFQPAKVLSLNSMPLWRTI